MYEDFEDEQLSHDYEGGDREEFEREYEEYLDSLPDDERRTEYFDCDQLG
jgi:hypothetical protein